MYHVYTYHCSPNYVMCTLLQLTYLPLLWNPQCLVRHFKLSHSDNILHLPVAAVTKNMTVKNAAVYYTVIYSRITYSFILWILLPFSSDANTNHLRHKLGQCSSLATARYSLQRVLSYYLQRHSNSAFFPLKSWRFEDWLSISLDPLQWVSCILIKQFTGRWECHDINNNYSQSNSSILRFIRADWGA